MDSFGRKGEGAKCSLSFEPRNMCCGITLNRNRRPVLFNIRSSSLNSRVSGYFFFELFSFSKIRRGILIRRNFISSAKVLLARVATIVFNLQTTTFTESKLK